MGSWNLAKPRVVTIATLTVIAIFIAVASVRLSAITLAVLFLMVLVTVFSFVDDAKSVNIILVWIATQNAIVPFLFFRSQESPTFWTEVLAASQVTVILVVITHFFFNTWAGRRRSPAFISSAILYSIVLVLIAVLHRGTNLFSSFNSAREAMVPALYLSLGFMISKSESSRVGLLRTIAGLTVVGAVFALVDAIFLGTRFWSNIDLGQYWIQVKHTPAYEVVNGLPGNLYENYDGVILSRAISFYGDPLAAGYSMALGYAALLFLYERSKRFKNLYLASIFVVLAGISVTYTRAAYIIVAIETLSLAIYWRSANKRIPRLLLLSVPLIIILLADKVLTANGSVLLHLQAMSFLPYLLSHPLGTGAGTLGGPEGAYLQIWYQYGILPLILFMIFMYNVYVFVKRSPTPYSYVGAGILVALVVSGFISEEMLTDTACSIGWVLLGMIASMHLRPAAEH
ncbi:hypothetical protein SAMN04489725_11574 [Alicyclobacillus hesperidum]|uniref:Uncharacterized protein n=1 Tax=Alicyclobacillus hesperidum TaxID=89784 RepID=A0A1H2WK60_9BACL|nr:hypothetical protein [Alicyclobacillus hesperidum]SDW80866.1 hypothetical protein SAMN04489725_11574 [Alicyclobacillus hesperidum]